MRGGDEIVQTRTESGGNAGQRKWENMFRLGEKQILKVARRVDFGFYLEEPESLAEEDRETGKTTGQERKAPARSGSAEKRTDGEEPREVLLPKAQVPQGMEPGDTVEVFLYRDSEDRLVATRRVPKLLLHEVGFLTVKEVTKIGAFLDWGLEKDLLLPFHEQPKEAHVIEGQDVLVGVYIDKSGRLAATMNVYPYLRQDSPYKAGDRVTGTVYETSRNFGTFVAVDDRYSALIPKRELVRDIRPGETISARVTRVHPDGKLDLSIRAGIPEQMETDAETLLRVLAAHGGTLPLTDKSSPEEIRETLHMSKNEFKRAEGRLYREEKIELLPDGIRIRAEGTADRV